MSQPAANGELTVLIAIADVDALVKRDSPVDQHAAHNTTSVYTGAQIFPMLPERLSTDLTSLNEHEDRAAIVIDDTLAQTAFEFLHSEIAALTETKDPIADLVDVAVKVFRRLAAIEALAQAGVPAGPV